MRIMFDVVHPADVHFFKNTIAALVEDNHQVLITSRIKDIVIPLLGELGLAHRVASAQGDGVGGLLAELVRRDFSLLRWARHFRPHVLVGNNSPSVTHVGFLLRRPSIVFDDTEINRYARLLYRPCVTEVHTPQCYRLDLGRKQVRYTGYHPLAYLHPNHFSSDSAVPQSYGLRPDEPYFLFRFVHWGAAHDLGVRGLTDEQKEELVSIVGRCGRVVVSAEGSVSESLATHVLPIRVADMHQILAGAAGLIGESATMCSEAACLGRLSILIDPFGRGYTDQLERTYGLMERHSPAHWENALQAARRLVQGSVNAATKEQRHRRLLADMRDVSVYQRQQILRLAAAGAAKSE